MSNIAPHVSKNENHIWLQQLHFQFRQLTSRSQQQKICLTWTEKKQRYKYDNDDDNDDDGRHEMRIENNWTGMIRKYISLCSMILWCIKYTKQKHWRLYSMPACRHCVAVILADVVKISVGQKRTMLPVHPRASKVKLWKELLKRKSKAKAVNCNRKPHIEHNTEPHSVPAVYTVNFWNCVNIFKQ